MRMICEGQPVFFKGLSGRIEDLYRTLHVLISKVVPIMRYPIANNIACSKIFRVVDNPLKSVLLCELLECRTHGNDFQVVFLEQFLILFATHPTGASTLKLCDTEFLHPGKGCPHVLPEQFTEAAHL